MLYYNNNNNETMSIEKKSLIILKNRNSLESKHDKGTVSTSKNTDHNQSFNFDSFNTEFKYKNVSQNEIETKKESVVNLMGELEKKTKMIEFYQNELKRRKQRFEMQSKSRSNTLREILANLQKLVKIQCAKNERLEQKIRIAKGQKEEALQQHNKSICESDLNYSQFNLGLMNETKKDDTLLLDESGSVLTLDKYM